MGITIQRLDQGYKGQTILFRYETDAVFRVCASVTTEAYSFTLVKEPLAERRVVESKDTLLADWLESPILIGALDGERVVGFLELSHEAWNHRLRISNLLVKEGYRGKGIGRRLLERAKEEARACGARALVLETQSCNVPAISFYQRMGMTLVGLDTACYSNEDMDRGEVRLEFGMPVASSVSAPR